MVADDSGQKGVETSPVVTENVVDPAVGQEEARFKTIDAGMNEYLKLLYAKIKAAVRSIKNKNS